MLKLIFKKQLSIIYIWYGMIFILFQKYKGKIQAWYNGSGYIMGWFHKNKYNQNILLY